MPHASVGELSLFYEPFGDPDDQPVVLIAGLGGQCLSWPEGFCEGLADRALYVMRFDNRDIGLSTKLDHLEYSFAAAQQAHANGEPVDPPYQLDDMAADVDGLLDVLGFESAHIVGLSLGGMIAQLVAINHRERVRTLTSIMSTTGNPEFGQPTPESIEALMWPAPSDRAEMIKQSLAQREIWGSPGLQNEAENVQYFGKLWDRDHHPTAVQRQFGAVLAATDREASLRALTIPTLVLHGDADRLIDMSGGARTAEMVPGAELQILEGMGHDLLSVYWPQLIEAILSHVLGAIVR